MFIPMCNNLAMRAVAMSSAGGTVACSQAELFSLITFSLIMMMSSGMSEGLGVTYAAHLRSSLTQLQVTLHTQLTYTATSHIAYAAQVYTATSHIAYAALLQLTYAAHTRSPHTQWVIG